MGHPPPPPSLPPSLIFQVLPASYLCVCFRLGVRRTIPRAACPNDNPLLCLAVCSGSHSFQVIHVAFAPFGLNPPNTLPFLLSLLRPLSFRFPSLLCSFPSSFYSTSLPLFSFSPRQGSSDCVTESVSAEAGPGQCRKYFHLLLFCWRASLGRLQPLISTLINMKSGHKRPPLPLILPASSNGPSLGRRLSTSLNHMYTAK